MTDGMIAFLILAIGAICFGLGVYAGQSEDERKGRK